MAKTGFPGYRRNNCLIIVLLDSFSLERNMYVIVLKCGLARIPGKRFFLTENTNKPKRETLLWNWKFVKNAIEAQIDMTNHFDSSNLPKNEKL